MYSSVETYVRGQLIDLGNSVGTVIKESHRVNPWVAHIGGDCRGGKGLIALAMDQALNPKRYPGGVIAIADSPDTKLKGENGGKYQLVFDNFNHVPAHEITGDGFVRSLKRFHAYDPAEASATIKTGFDWLLRDLQKRHPEARVVVAANIRRDDDLRSMALHDLRSDVLDINMNVTGSSDRDVRGEFHRKIEITCRDEAVLAAILKKFQNQGAALAASLTPPPRSEDWWMNPPSSYFTQPQA